MTIEASTLTILGVEGIGENPLPCFRNPVHDKDARSNGTMFPEEETLFGWEAGERILPYRVQDRYTRNKRQITIQTLVMENGILRAVFLPGFGGKLHSLVDLRSGKELLFSNSVLQPGNLAIRNAWLSGGIEWNIGQLGHTFTTCAPMFFAKLQKENGEPFLRMYEYERQKRIFWQIDFHLPDGSECLQTHVRIVNDQDSETPMYWWTNIACTEDKETRVFSATPEVVYQDVPKMIRFVQQRDQKRNVESLNGAPNFFGHAKLPNMEDSLGGRLPFDASYPQNYPRSNEYFFQNPKELASPWEAVAYGDGAVFFERSTQPLRFRKMFCWGMHRGGRLWCDYLSEAGKGDYLEIQSGLAPTQVSGLCMAANSVIEFTQVFGCAKAEEPRKLHQEWNASRAHMNALVDAAIPASEVLLIDTTLKACADFQPAASQIVHMGTGWGALERQRRAQDGEKALPKGFCFPDNSLTDEQRPWLSLLETGSLPCEKQLPVSFMVDRAWEKRMREGLRQGKGLHFNALNCLGVLLYENGEREEAAALWEESNQWQPNPFAYRNLAVAAEQKGELARALEMMESAYRLEQGRIDPAFTEEYLRLLLDHGAFEKAWEIYSQSPKDVAQTERVRVLASHAAIEVGEYAFLEKLFTQELSDVREGENRLCDLWFRRQAMKLAEERGVICSQELLQEVINEMNPPANIDFRMFVGV